MLMAARLGGKGKDRVLDMLNETRLPWVEDVLVHLDFRGGDNSGLKYVRKRSYALVKMGDERYSEGIRM